MKERGGRRGGEGKGGSCMYMWNNSVGEGEGGGGYSLIHRINRCDWQILVRDITMSIMSSCQYGMPMSLHHDNTILGLRTSYYASNVSQCNYVTIPTSLHVFMPSCDQIFCFCLSSCEIFANTRGIVIIWLDNNIYAVLIILLNDNSKCSGEFCHPAKG